MLSEQPRQLIGAGTHTLGSPCGLILVLLDAPRLFGTRHLAGLTLRNARGPFPFPLRLRDRTLLL